MTSSPLRVRGWGDGCVGGSGCGLLQGVVWSWQSHTCPECSPPTHTHPPNPAPPSAGLKDVITGDTLCDEKFPVVLERMEFPDPVIKVGAGNGTSTESLLNGSSRLWVGCC